MASSPPMIQSVLRESVIENLPSHPVLRIGVESGSPRYALLADLRDRGVEDDVCVLEGYLFRLRERLDLVVLDEQHRRHAGFPADSPGSEPNTESCPFAAAPRTKYCAGVP